MMIQLISQFGQPVRGVSPYSDGLLAGLRNLAVAEIKTVDYSSAYPGVLHPAGAYRANTGGMLSWYSPGSWRAVAEQTQGVMHIQHWAQPLAVYLWQLVRMAKQNGRRVVVTVHNPVAHESIGLFTHFERRFLGSADLLLAHGEAGCEILRKRFGPNGPEVRCVGHGMTVMARPVVAADGDYSCLNLDPSCRHVVLFGNLRGYKGVDVLLDAWSQVRESLPDVRLVIAGRLWNGRGSLLGRASAALLGAAADAHKVQSMLASKERMRGVILREGFQRDEDIDALLRICEFAVFPYRRFTAQSGAACRAAACGRPLLVSRVGALPDLAIDESWIVDPGDSAALAARMLDKLSAPRIAQAARCAQLDKVRKYGWETIARDHLAAYRELA